MRTSGDTAPAWVRRLQELAEPFQRFVRDYTAEKVVKLRGSLQLEHTLARMGGDEFMVVLPDIKQEKDVIRVAENILQAVRRPFDVESFQIPITASVGIAFHPEDGKDSEALMKAADLAMYEAKSQGGNMYCRYSSELKFKSLIPQA